MYEKNVVDYILFTLKISMNIRKNILNKRINYNVIKTNKLGVTALLDNYKTGIILSRLLKTDCTIEGIQNIFDVSHIDS